MRSTFGTCLAAALMAALAGCAEDAGVCDALELESALFNAYRGDTVRLGACTIHGAFTVPEGVTLSGEGPESSVLQSTGTVPVLWLTSGDLAPRVTDLAVVSDGTAGIVVRGEGRAGIERVAVRASRGIGIGVEGLVGVSLDQVTLTGPVTADNADRISGDATPEDTATHGLVVVDTGEVVMSQVSATGFARMGVLLIAEETTWRLGSASDNLAAGVMVHGGHAVLEDLVVCRTFQGLSLIPAYAGVFVAGARVETSRLEVCDCEGLGLFHDSAEASHIDLSATANDDAAVWVQRSPRFELAGESEVSDNRLAGVVLIEVGDAVLSSARVARTEEITRVYGMSRVTVGDGVQVVRPSGSVALRALELVENGRVGLLLDLADGDADEVSLTDVVVDGQEGQLGAIAQGSGVPGGWDEGVTRRGATPENDAEHDGSLSTVSAVEREDVPAVDAIIDEGLAWLLGGP